MKIFVRPTPFSIIFFVFTFYTLYKVGRLLRSVDSVCLKDKVHATNNNFNNFSYILASVQRSSENATELALLAEVS